MTRTASPEAFEGRLLAMLRDVVDEAPSTQREGAHRRRSTKRRSFALVAASLAVLVTSLFVGSAVGGGQVFRIDGLQALRDPRGLEQQLRADGMDVTIVPVPLTKGPDAENEGRWWWVTIDRPNQLTQEEFIRLKEQVGLLVGPGNPAARNPDPSSPHILELPKLSGHVTLFVGYEVPAGEFTVDTFDRINELSPVGAFYCLGVDPDDPSALGAVLEARGYSVMWTFESGNAGSRVAEPPPDTVATWAWLRGPGLADIRIAPAGSEGEQYQAAEGTFPLGVTPPWSQPCTDDNQ